MKKSRRLIALLVCLSNLFLIPAAFAVSVSGKAVIDGKIKDVTLEDLEGDGLFLRGKNFILVDGITDQPIPMTLPKEMWHRADNQYYAQNVYYHLTQARKYFDDNFHLAHAPNEEPMIVRLNIRNGFSVAGHFKNLKVEDQYNDSLTVPASNTLRDPKFSKWETEIWFRPPREEEIQSSFELTTEVINSREYKSAIEKGVLLGGATTIGRDLVSNIPVDFRYHLSAILISFGAWEVLPQAFHKISQMHKTHVYADMAIIPQVIRHEYAHAVFAKQMGLLNTPVIEGYADYFAAIMLNKPKYNFTLKPFSQSPLGKNGNDSVLYNPYFERFRTSTSDFVLSVLWMLRKEIGAKDFDPAVFAAPEFMEEGGNIRHDLVDALGLGFHKVFEKEKADVLDWKMSRLLRSKKNF